MAGGGYVRSDVAPSRRFAAPDVCSRSPPSRRRRSRGAGTAARPTRRAPTPSSTTGRKARSAPATPRTATRPRSTRCPEDLRAYTTAADDIARAAISAASTSTGRRRVSSPTCLRRGRSARVPDRGRAPRGAHRGARLVRPCRGPHPAAARMSGTIRIARDGRGRRLRRPRAHVRRIRCHEGVAGRRFRRR